MTPILTTTRLVLKPYTAAMVEDRHVEWLRKLEVIKYSEQRHLQHTLESQHSYLNKFPQGSHIWLISLDKSSSIGTITAYVDVPNKVADVGILIGEPSVWGQGYATEAWKGVMDFLFKDGIRKIEAGYMASNHAMDRVCFHAGMTHEGDSPGHFLLAGKPEDMIRVARFR